MLNIVLDKRIILTSNDLNEASAQLRVMGLANSDYYLLHNGKIACVDAVIKHGDIKIVLRTLGGKGGFGSMLRAIGAQIEKTTNREACRDLSGRRLRDINEEKRLKKWITQQAEREKEAAERKQKKLEKLCEKPKHVFIDSDYDSERSKLPEIVENAVAKGLEASCSNSSALKRKKTDLSSCKKKRKLWIDSEVDDLSSSGEDEDSDSNDTKSSSIVGNSESNSCDSLAFSKPLSAEDESNKPCCPGENVNSLKNFSDSGNETDKEKQDGHNPVV